MNEGNFGRYVPNVITNELEEGEVSTPHSQD